MLIPCNRRHTIILEADGFSGACVCCSGAFSREANSSVADFHWLTSLSELPNWPGISRLWAGSSPSQKRPRHGSVCPLWRDRSGPSRPSLLYRPPAGAPQPSRPRWSLTRSLPQSLTLLRTCQSLQSRWLETLICCWGHPICCCGISVETLGDRVPAADGAANGRSAREVIDVSADLGVCRSAEESGNHDHRANTWLWPLSRQPGGSEVSCDSPTKEPLYLQRE